LLRIHSEKTDGWALESSNAARILNGLAKAGFFPSVAGNITISRSKSIEKDSGLSADNESRFGAYDAPFMMEATVSLRRNL